MQRRPSARPESCTRYGVSATCRASFGLYNTRVEVDSLAQALMKAQDFFA
jgi:cysteine desulfurase / selenocysteine lyase